MAREDLEGADKGDEPASEWSNEDLAEQLEYFAEIWDQSSGEGGWPAEVYREVAKRLRNA